MAEADSGWFLRHRDGVEHGPFRLADLVSAAESGNVAEDTSLRHETVTRGTWVLAPRLQPIANAIVRHGAAGSGPPEATPGAPPTSGPRRVVPNAPAGPTPPTAAPKSAFRRPAALPGTAPFRSPRPVEAARASDPNLSNEGVSAADAAPSSESPPTQTVRIHQHAYPVPKRFVDALAALFDFRFRYFITPWIIKILWGLAVAGALLWLTRLTYDFWVQPSMEAPGPRTGEGAPGWEFEPLAGQSIFESRPFVFSLQAGSVLLVILCTRVVLELGIVVFRVATDIADLKRSLPKS